MADRADEGDVPEGGQSDPSVDPQRKDAVLRLLGLALRAGALRLGSGPVMRAMESEPPGIVFVARDAGRNLRRNLHRVRGRSRIEETLFDGEDLARAFGRRRLAVVSVHETGFVAGLEKHLFETR